MAGPKHSVGAERSITEVPDDVKNLADELEDAAKAQEEISENSEETPPNE